MLIGKNNAWSLCGALQLTSPVHGFFCSDLTLLQKDCYFVILHQGHGGSETCDSEVLKAEVCAFTLTGSSHSSSLISLLCIRQILLSEAISKRNIMASKNNHFAELGIL